MKSKPQLINVRITRGEFLLLPMETRRRILKEQAQRLVIAGGTKKIETCLWKWYGAYDYATACGSACGSQTKFCQHCGRKVRISPGKH